MINFTTTVPGEYTFSFANFDIFGTDKEVTLALHTNDGNGEDSEPVEFDFDENKNRIIRDSN